MAFSGTLHITSNLASPWLQPLSDIQNKSPKILCAKQRMMKRVKRAECMPDIRSENDGERWFCRYTWKCAHLHTIYIALRLHRMSCSILQSSIDLRRTLCPSLVIFPDDWPVGSFFLTKVFYSSLASESSCARQALASMSRP